MVIILKIIPDLLLLTLKGSGGRHSGGNCSFAETSTASHRYHKTGVYFIDAIQLGRNFTFSKVKFEF